MIFKHIKKALKITGNSLNYKDNEKLARWLRGDLMEEVVICMEITLGTKTSSSGVVNLPDEVEVEKAGLVWKKWKYTAGDFKNLCVVSIIALKGKIRNYKQKV